MNRRERRAALRRMRGSDARIPVFGPADRIVALIRPEEVRRYAGAPNVRLVRARRSGQIVRINLRTLSDDSALVIHRADPRKYSHDHETTTNPPMVWTLRRLGSNDPGDEEFVQRIFRSSVLDNLRRAA